MAYHWYILEEDPEKRIYLVFSCTGVPLEIITVFADDTGEEVAIHAMKTRKKYYSRSKK